MADNKNAPKASAPANVTPIDKARKARKSPPKDESKEARFRRVCGTRLAKAVRMMSYIERIGRGSAYSYTPEQANKVVQTLVDATAQVKAAFGPRAGTKAALDMIDL